MLTKFHVLSAIPRMCRDELNEEVADRDNLLVHALEGRSDEVHCGCCAPLRCVAGRLLWRAWEKRGGGEG